MGYYTLGRLPMHEKFEGGFQVREGLNSGKCRGYNDIFDPIVYEEIVAPKGAKTFENQFGHIDGYIALGAHIYNGNIIFEVMDIRVPLIQGVDILNTNCGRGMFIMSASEDATAVDVAYALQKRAREFTGLGLMVDVLDDINNLVAERDKLNEKGDFVQIGKSIKSYFPCTYKLSARGGKTKRITDAELGLKVNGGYKLSKVSVKMYPDAVTVCDKDRDVLGKLNKLNASLDVYPCLGALIDKGVSEVDELTSKADFIVGSDIHLPTGKHQEFLCGNMARGELHGEGSGVKVDFVKPLNVANMSFENLTVVFRKSSWIQNCKFENCVVIFHEPMLVESCEFIGGELHYNPKKTPSMPWSNLSNTNVKFIG